VIPRLHIVTDDEILLRPDFLDRARGVLAVGGSEVALHIRGPGLEGRRIYQVAEALRKVAESSGSLLLVNDRVDVALALNLPGVHLGQRSLPPGEVRELVGEDRLIGVSTHGAEEAEAGERGGADYLLVGTLYPTASHPNVLPGGLPRVTDVAAVTSLPLVGIGGITPMTVGEIFQAGAHGVAVRGGVWNDSSPKSAAGVFLREIGRCRRES
jgi:thiamine-phosphate pyrophosphorylase